MSLYVNVPSEQHRAENWSWKYDYRQFGAIKKNYKLEELVATETVAEVAEVAEEPEVTETVLEQRPEMDAIQQNYLLRLNLTHTNWTSCRREELPEEITKQCG